MGRVGVYLGDDDDRAGNIQRVLSAWGSYLADDYELDAFGSAELPESAEAYYNYSPTTSRASRILFDKPLVAYLNCRDYIKTHSPDVVLQVWKYKTHGPGVTLAGRRFGIPVISRLSGDAFNEYKQVSGVNRYGIYLLTAVFGRVPIRFSQKIITLGPYERELLTQRGAKSDQIVLLPPPLDLSDRFSPPSNKRKLRPQLGVPTDPYIALYVGRLTKQKGMDFLIDVISQVERETEDVLFILVGDGPYRDYFASRYSDDTVRTKGRIRHEAIHKYYQISDVFIHPSPFEGVPLVMLEALECGTPVIARDIGDNAFITDNLVHSPEEMADMIASQDVEFAFLNRDYFSYSYQQKTLTHAVDQARQ